MDKMSVSMLEGATAQLNDAKVHNITMVPWWEQTVETIRKLGSMIESTKCDLDKMSKALLTICPTGTEINETNIFCNDEKFRELLDSYDESDPVFGPAIKASKESLKPIRMVLMKANNNLKFLTGYVMTETKKEETSEEPKPQQQQEPTPPVETKTAEKKTEPVLTEMKKSPTVAPDTKIRKKIIQRIENGWSQLLIPGMPKDHYMISKNGLVVNRYNGLTVRPIRMHGVDCVVFKDANDNTKLPVTIEVSKLRTYAVEPDTNNEPPKSDDDFRWLDWIPGVSNRKYKIFRSGRIFDTNASSWMHPLGDGLSVVISGGDLASRCEGVTSYSQSHRIASLVFKAYNKEYRDATKLYLTYLDGDMKNFSLDNLQLKRAVGGR